jgi:DNA polymerase III subunit chi
MTTQISPKIIFYHVKNNQAKLHLICTKALEAFRDEKRLLITVNSFQAAQYVDQLLWRSPANGFMPHVIADTSTAEWVAITLQDQHNVNQAPTLFNLGMAYPPLSLKMEEVYEIYDETHPDKLALSEQRLKAYQALGLMIKREEVRN